MVAKEKQEAFIKPYGAGVGHPWCCRLLPRGGVATEGVLSVVKRQLKSHLYLHHSDLRQVAPGPAPGHTRSTERENICPCW